MKEFVEKLIEKLENHMKYCKTCHEEFPNAKMSLTYEVQINAYKNAIKIVNQLAEEYNNDFCEWEYDEFETKWQTDCGVLFALHDSDREITQYCPYCGKKIKVAPYQPKGE